MNIDIASLKIEVNRLNKLIQEYEQNYLNLYNELSSASFFWKDRNSINFFDKLTKEKIDVNTTFDELNKIKDIYDYVILKYKSFGSKIKFDLSVKDSIYTNLNDYLMGIEDVINSYKNIDLSFCSKVEVNLVLGELRRLENIEKNLFDFKDKLRSTFENIENIENEINIKLSKIRLGIIKEDELTEYV